MPETKTGLPGWVGALFASHFLGFGLFLPFFPLVLEARGLTVDEIGFVLGLSTVVRIAANPVLTNLSDRTGRRRISIFAYSVLSGVFLGGFAATSGITSAWVTVAGLMAFWSPIVPLCDAYALDVVRNTGADYARMRLWGSVAFVIANLVGGWLVSVGSPLLLVAGLAVSVLSTGVVAICLPGQAPRHEEEQTGPDKPAAVFRSPWFIAVLWIGGLLQATHAAYYGFSTLYWVSAGIDKLSIGVLWAIGVVAEIALFYGAKRLNPRFGPLQFLMIAAGGSIVRWGLFPFAEGLVAIAAIQILHAISFGAAHLGAVSLLSRVVPRKWAATGQGLLSTSSGLQLALGLAICGPLYNLNPGYPFWVMALAAGVALIALLLLRPLIAEKLQAAERA